MSETGYEKKVAEESGKPILKLENPTPQGLEGAMAACSEFFISGEHYSHQCWDREYAIPENARWTRVGRKQVRFYTNNLPEITAQTKDRRRAYHEIPEGAKKLKRINKRFEWMGDENYGWVVIPETPECAVRTRISEGKVQFLLPGEKEGQLIWA